MAAQTPSPAAQPAYPHPEGLLSNFVDPDDHSDIVYLVGYGFTIAAFVAFMIRLYTRIFVLRRGLLADDYLEWRSRRRVRWAVYSMLFVVVAYSLTAAFTTVFGCSPCTPPGIIARPSRQGLGVSTAKKRHIRHQLPHLQMPRRQKVALISLFVADPGASLRHRGGQRPP
ncbi:uncharacterized protein PG986_000802 [Apiospora aurea]|uniref:Uncharacterized protein n=1 Tax=Apiospora aurea TaxID=335848 RepID=A0ABR1QWR1_9PEZI